MDAKCKGIVLVCFTLLFSSAISAATSVPQPWSGKTKVLTLYPFQGGLIFFSEYRNAEISICDGGSRFLIAKDHPNYDVMASTLMAAFMAGKSINFYIADDQQRNCSPKIDRFMVYHK